VIERDRVGDTCQEKILWLIAHRGNITLDSPVPSETGFAPMKYALYFMGQAFHGAGKPGNDVGVDSGSSPE